MPGYLSSSDSSDEEDVVSFKRARRTSTEPTSPPKEAPVSKRPCQNGNGRLQPSVNANLSVPPGRSLTSLHSLQSIINSGTNAASAPRPGPAVNGESHQKNGDASELSSSEIMEVMGFQKGQGLAKYLEAVKIPVSKFFSMDEFEEKVDKLNIQLADTELVTIEDVPVKEEVCWISCDKQPPLNLQTLLSSRKLGPRITNVEIDKQNAFIDPKVYDELMECKKLYENAPDLMYQKVRAKANLYERINKGPFMCRAAMKMANLDAILNFELTNPKRKDGSSALSPNKLLYFSDVCAGPGGFTEYILWKKKWEAKGFGLTLRGELDFDVKNFVAEHETFEPIYGPAEDGNIYNPDNVNAYVHHVLSNTEKKGVHLMMADGGFTVVGQKHLQEVLSYQIILSQIFVALAVVQVEGHFICKLFDTFTPFTVALLYFLYRSFDTVAIHKPRTSRPANSERYIICKWKKTRDITTPILSYLADCHYLMWLQQNGNEEISILELFPISILSNGFDPFYIYLRLTNDRIARHQIDTLKRMVAFVRDEVLENQKMQEKARAQVMKLWNVPQKIAMPAMIRTCDTACMQLLQELPLTMLRHREKELLPETIELLFKSAYDWRFVPVCGEKNATNRAFYMSLGQNMVYRYLEVQWVLIAQHEPLLELPSKTLVYAEFVHEVHGRAVSDQNVVEAFHIIDALSLGGVDIRRLHYTQRQEMCAKFAKAVTKLGTLPVRAKAPVRMENLEHFVSMMENRVVKGAGVGSHAVCPLDMTDPTTPFVIPEGILFIKITRDPWQMVLNRKSRQKMFFNTSNGESNGQIPEDAISGFFNTMGNRVLWTWDKETNVVLTKLEENDPRIGTLNPRRLHTCNLVSYINYTINQPPTVSPTRTTLYLATSNGTKNGDTTGNVTVQKH